MFKDKKDSLLEQARFAADNSDWKGYILAMGGLHTKLKDRPIKLHYDLNESPRVCQRLNNLRNWNYEKIKSLYIRIS